MKTKLFLFVFLSTLCVAQTKKVLFIGIDGCRPDALELANTPNIDLLKAQSIRSDDALCTYETWSANGWSSMLTGVWNNKHKAFTNSFTGADFVSYPSIISRIEAINPALRTISNVHWAPINSTIIGACDVKNTVTTDLAVKQTSVNALTSDNPDLLFVAFDDVDHAGHAAGFSPTVPSYLQAIEATDAYIGEILTALQNRPTYANEDWLIIVTTDHGGTLANGHGGGELTERDIFTIFSSPLLTPTVLTKSIVTSNQTINTTNLNASAYASPINQTPFNFGSNQDFTIEFWVKPTSYTADAPMLGNKNWNSGTNKGFVFSALNGGFWKFNIGDGTDRKDIKGGKLVINEWMHIAASFDRDGLMTVYENGVVVGFLNMVNINDINSGLPFIINQDGTTTYNFKFSGIYKDIRVWNSVIPNNVLINWATQPITASHPNYNQLLANWTCNETTGTTLLDSSVNANNATITGTVARSSNVNVALSIYDYSGTTRQTDNAIAALDWLCIPIQPSWNLDGVSRVPSCTTLNQDSYDNKNSQFYISPNPANDLIQIKFSSTSEKILYRILDINGKVILNDSNSSNSSSFEWQLNVSHLNQGMYILEIKDGNRVYTKKFLKK
jgi:predicted AlkP superfamily pyrophosphatase or phosphodiesterase